MTLPRLTGALREFSNVSAGSSETEDPQRLQRVVAERRRDRARREAGAGVTWEQLTAALQRQEKVIGADSIKIALRQLIQIAQEIGESAGEQRLQDLSHWQLGLGLVKHHLFISPLEMFRILQEGE